jgi:hypothetical protein
MSHASNWASHLAAPLTALFVDPTCRDEDSRSLHPTLRLDIIPSVPLLHISNLVNQQIRIVTDLRISVPLIAARLRCL